MPRIRVGALDLAPNGQAEKYWEPDRWSPRHALASRMFGAGLKPGEIALAMDLTPARVSTIINDERARHYILEASQRAADGILDLNLRLKAHAEEALSTIVEQMRSAEKEVTRQKAAFGILDRAGYAPIQRHNIAPAPPQIPEGLGQIITEAHAEISETRRTIRFRAPSPAEVIGHELKELADGTTG